MFGRVYVGLRLPPPRFAGVVFDIALLSDWGHLLRVPTMCDDLTVVTSVPLQGGTVSCLLCLLTGCLLVLFKCLDLHLPRVLCQGSPLFWRISSTVGI